MCELLDVDPAGLDDEALAALVVELEDRADRVEAARLRVLGEWDARAVWAADGAYSGVGWLAARGSKPRAALSALLRDARQLRQMPETAAAVWEGRLAPAKGRVLCRAVNPRTRETFSRDESMLVVTLARLTVDEAGQAVRFWMRHADVDGPDPRDREANSLWLSQTLDGRWQLRAELDQESGAMVSNVLAGLVDAGSLARRDQGVELAGQGPQLRAEALVEMARRATAAVDTAAPARPLLWVVAGQETLASGKGACELAGAGAISAVTAQRLRCDCDLVKVLHDPDGTPHLDFGRAQRTASGTQRRLLWLRDRGCTFPGCDRPPAWCEAHHIIWWENGGPTDLHNLCLLCRYHHHRCHEGGYRVAWEGDQLVFYRPDGSRLEPPVIAA
jgi:hypothetical protein